MNCARAVLWALLMMCTMGVSCRKTAPIAAHQPNETLSSYVGIGAFGGSPVNVLIVTSEGTDSSHTLAGSITYQSQTSDFSEITSDPNSDTLSFSYVRSNVDYRAWALELSVGIYVHFTEPSGIAPFRMNRETGGHNMTGIWTGEMSSTLLQGQRSVTLTMDQTGAAFEGEAVVTFVEPWVFDIAAGSVSGNDFQLSGTVHGSDAYPTTWQGNYVGFDTISGVWNAGGETEVDGGEFLFSRWFR